MDGSSQKINVLCFGIALHPTYLRADGSNILRHLLGAVEVSMLVYLFSDRITERKGGGEPVHVLGLIRKCSALAPFLYFFFFFVMYLTLRGAGCNVHAPFVSAWPPGVPDVMYLTLLSCTCTPGCRG